MKLRSGAVKRKPSVEANRKRPPSTLGTSTVDQSESMLASRMVTHTAASMQETLNENPQVRATVSSTIARTSTMKLSSMSSRVVNPPECSPIKRTASASPRNENLKDKSSKRKSNLNITNNDDTKGN